jgi:hypothetical protein
MKIYGFGYWSHEECPRYLLTCVNKYTPEQFADLCSDLYKQVYEESEEKWNNTVEDLIAKVLEKLIVNFGFNELTPDCSFNPVKDLDTDDLHLISKTMRL